MQTFAQQGKKQMPQFIIKAITDLLEVLKSPIVYPTNNTASKLLAIVKGREDVYTNMTALMELIDIESELFKRDIIDGLKNTWQELTNITTRNIRDISNNDENLDLASTDSVEDNLLSNISKAKYISAKVSFDILDRIEQLENPDKIQEEIINQNDTGNIIERYAEN